MRNENCKSFKQVANILEKVGLTNIIRLQHYKLVFVTKLNISIASNSLV